MQPEPQAEHVEVKMTNLDKLKALHEKWLIGTDDDAEMAQEAVMQTHFLALIERVEKAEEALGDIRSIAANVQSSYDRNGPQYTIDGAEHYEASYVLGEMSGIVEIVDDLRTAIRALGGDND